LAIVVLWRRRQRLRVTRPFSVTVKALLRPVVHLVPAGLFSREPN
jgi:hypothetical protein